MFMWWVATPMRVLPVRVVEHDVGVRAGRDDALARVQPEHPGRRGRRSSRPSAPATACRRRRPGRSGRPGARRCRCRWGSWRSRRCPAPSGPSCRTGSGRWTRSARSLVRRPCHRSAPVRLVLAAQRRRADPLGALEAGRAELVLQRQVQVLRAGLGEHVAARRRAPPRPRSRASLTRTGARSRAGSRRPPRPARSPGWSPRPPAPAAGSGRGRSDRSRRGPGPAATRTSMAMPFSACIMIMAPLSRRLLHRPQDLAVVAVEHPRVRHEQLEAGDALVGRPAGPSP